MHPCRFAANFFCSISIISIWSFKILEFLTSTLAIQNHSEIKKSQNCEKILTKESAQYKKSHEN